MTEVRGAHRRVGPEGPRPGARGQSTVEFALIIPLLVLLALAVVQVGVLIRTRVMVTHAAREAVREAAVGGSRSEVFDASAASGDLRPDRLTAEVTERGGRVEVTIRYRAPTDVLLVGPLLGDVGFVSVATMRIEG